VLYRSIFCEGLARPEGGIKPVLDLLVRRFRELGGELRMRSGVERILTRGGRAVGVRLDDGTELEAERVFSSAGRVETLALAGLDEAGVRTGALSFVESLSVLDRTPAELGHRAAITWFNDSERFHWERPREGLIDPRTGVLCCPSNYAPGPAPAQGNGTGAPAAEGLMRVTVLAHHGRWTALDEPAYRAAKVREEARALDALAAFAPDPRPHRVFADVFTPRTIERFTWHRGGTVYGTPDKSVDGRTPLEGLFLIGTDQGLVGVIGALMSGIGIANAHGLRDAPAAVASPAAPSGSTA
jgi:phytoene dehydrogenase-like protein